MSPIVDSYTPKQFARIIGVSTSTLRRWEREGLVSAKRDSSGERFYSPDMKDVYLQQKAQQSELKSQLSKQRIVGNTSRARPLHHSIVVHWQKIGLVMLLFSLLLTSIAAVNILRSPSFDRTSLPRSFQSILGVFDTRVPLWDSLSYFHTPATPALAEPEPTSTLAPTASPVAASSVTLSTLHSLYTDLVARFDSFTSSITYINTSSSSSSPDSLTSTPTPIPDITMFPYRSHSSLTNLTNSDDHTQYTYGSGRAGGQTVVGGTDANDVLTLQSSTATTGTTSTAKALKIVVGSGGETEALTILNNGSIGFQKTNPGFTLDVGGIVNATAIYTNGTPMVSSQWTTSGTSIFYNTGNVGVGTSTPTTALDISGSLKATGLVFPTGAVAGYVLTTDSNGVASWTDVSSSAGPWTLTGNNLYPDSTSNNLAIGATDAGSAKLYVNGNVGIGTTAPTYLLEIYDDRNGVGELFLDNPNAGTGAASGFLLNNDTAGQGYLRYYSSNNTVAGSTWKNSLVLGANSSANGIVIASASTTADIRLAAGGNTSYDLTILGSSGNVGIGTTAPTYLLDVNGTAFLRGTGSTTGLLVNSAGNVIVGRTDSPDSGSAMTVYRGLALSRSLNDSINNPLTFQKGRAGAIVQGGDELGIVAFEGFDGSDYEQGAYIFGKVEGTPALNVMPTSLGFYTRDSTVSGTPQERMHISPSGNVGIGTTVPRYKLHVANSTYGLTLPLLVQNQYSTGGIVGIGFLNEQVGVNPNFAKAAIVHERSGSYGIGNLHFLVNSVGDTSTVTMSDGKMTILTSGNIGIGTTSPIAKLDVSGDRNKQGQLFVHSDVPQSDGSLLLGSTLGVGANIYAHTNPDGTIASAASAPGLRFISSGLDILTSDETSGTRVWDQRMRIDIAGNVGIGTTSPGAKLQVEGNVSFPNYLFSVINDNSVDANQAVVALLSPNLPAGGNMGLIFGKTSSDYNRGTLRYTHVGDGSTSNRVSIDFYGANNLLNVLASGNVGIGTTAPQDKLHLEGNSYVSSGIRMLNTFDGNTDYWNIGTRVTAAGDHYLSIEDSGTKRLAIDDNGNVGIGTTSPTTALHVYNPNSSVVALFESNDTSNALLKLRNVNQNDSDGMQIGARTNEFRFDNRQNGGAITFYTDNGTEQERMRIASSGNLGIGITAPEFKLQVSGGTNETPVAQFKVTSSGTDIMTALSLRKHNANVAGSGAALEFTGQYTASLGRIFGRYAPDSTYGEVGIQTINSGGLATRMLIDKDGNVGIGTTAPSYTLDVESTGTDIARFTGTNSTGCTLSDGGVIACSSDQNLKKNILATNLGLDAVMALRPVEFNWNSQAEGDKKYLGFIAQEVEQVAPTLVTTDSSGYKQLNSIGLIPVVAKAIQEQQGLITTIQSNLTPTEKIASMTASLDQLTTNVTAWDTIIAPLQAIVQDIQTMFVSLQTQLGLVQTDLSTTQNNVASLSASLNSLNVDYTSWKEAIASGSGILGASDSALLDHVATVSSLLVQNKTTTFDLTVLNKLTTGVLEIGAGIDGDEINSVGGIRFQTLSQGPIDFMNGKVIIDVDGSITAKHLKLDTTDFASSTAGRSVLKAGKSALTVDTSSITPESLVFITPITLTDVPIAVTQKSTGVGFTVTIPQTISTDLEFQWLIIN